MLLRQPFAGLTKLGNALPLVLCALLLISQHADARGILSGYRDFTFGMAEVDLKRLVVVSANRHHPSETWLETGNRFVIAGDEFNLSFLITGGTLHRISLSRWSEESERNCRSSFDLLLQEFSSQYGVPDREPETVGDDSRTIVDSTFTFDDGSRISVSISAGEFGCGRYIDFQSAKDAAEN